jgi:hypothetical protein
MRPLYNIEILYNPLAELISRRVVRVQAVMNIDSYQGNIAELQAKIKDGFEYGGRPKNKNIKKIIIIHGGKVVQLTRRQVNKDLSTGLEKLL